MLERKHTLDTQKYLFTATSSEVEDLDNLKRGNAY
jgi:hypothetical protein